MSAGHGGKRRHHVMPALSPAQVAHARSLRAQGAGYKALMRIFGVCRETLSRAVNGSRTYRGFL